MGAAESILLAMRVAALQLDLVRDDVAGNLGRVEAGLRGAAAGGVELVVLPEMWPTSFADLASEAGRAGLAATPGALERVRALTGELGLVVAGSAYGEVAEGLPTNRLHLYDRGRLALAYDKVHLFSPTAEAAGFAAGDAPPAVVETSLGRLSGVVCYDLRFGELMLEPFLGGAELVVLPAQWPSPRAAHWRALVLGRAVEGQCFVVAANRLGTERVGRRGLELEFPGNSLVVGPAGEVLAEGRGQGGLVVAEVDLEQARRMRIHVPVAKDRRPELYRGWPAVRYMG